MESLCVYLHNTPSVLLLQCKANKEKGVCCLTVYRPYTVKQGFFFSFVKISGWKKLLEACDNVFPFFNIKLI